MGIHTLSGECETRVAACMIDSVTGWAFGPVFRSAEDCERFQAWARPQLRRLGATDLRGLDDADLVKIHCAWLVLPDCQWCGERCVGLECEEHEGYLCASAGELSAGPIGAPDEERVEAGGAMDMAARDG